MIIFKLSIRIIIFFILAIFKILSPFIILRIGSLITNRIGHFAANTEIYLCEKDQFKARNKNKILIDIFSLKTKPVCNEQLYKMINRKIIILPYFFIQIVMELNKKYFQIDIKDIKIDKEDGDRDINNIFDITLPHLKFKRHEERLGKKFLSKIGVPINSEFICLLVRDNAYLNEADNSYHNYRNANITDYKLAIEALIEKGYYIIRMGAKVNMKLDISNKKYIDYAYNGLRTDFMDVYLGANCKFAISTSSGWDAIPYIFRKPIVYTPIVPLGYMFTFSHKFMAITKHYINLINNTELSIEEIFKLEVGYALDSQTFINKNISLIDNTPKEIKDAVLEFDNYIYNNFLLSEEESILQTLFWEKFNKFHVNSSGMRIHGEIKSVFCNTYLKNNSFLLK